MSDLPAPSGVRLKPPSWLDGRLVVGAVLVLLSVVVGAKIIASSGRYDVVWAASHAIAPGTTLTKSDLLRVKVRFKDHGTIYISANGPSPAGRTTIQSLASGQLIASVALPASTPAQVRLVTVPVARLHMPRGNDLHGVQVDLYVTPKSGFGSAQPAPQLVLANVTISDTIIDSSLGGSGGSGVVLAVPLAFVDAVVSAAQLGAVDLVRVPADVTAAQPSRGSDRSAPASPSAPGESAPAIPSTAAVPSPSQSS